MTPVPVPEVKRLSFKIHAIGDQINRGVDFLHDTDHGLRICNRDSPTNQVKICLSSMYLGMSVN